MEDTHKDYNGEMFIVFADIKDIWHVHDHKGCAGRSNHPFLALVLASELNMAVVRSYQWPIANTHRSLIPITELTTITPSIISTALKLGEKAWLN